MSAPWRNRFDQIAPYILIVLAIIAIYGGVGTYYNGRADHRQDVQHIADQQENAVTSCENANESRQASRTLWFFVVDLAAKTAPPERITYLSDVRAWIGEVYQPHDCTDLSRKYPLPPPPSIPAG